MAEKNLAVIADKETRLAIAPEYNNDQIRILAETVAKGCDQNELGFFLNVCKLKRLDPFSQQVHCVKRWDSDLGREKMTIQVGIDGFRVIAARTDELAGISEPEYDSEDEQHPEWARVTVYRYGRSDEKIPYAAKARWSEYVQTKKDGNPNRMWLTKPYIMLGKCAEALALRKAFPDELSGMYSEDEMSQADSEGVTPASVERKKQVQQPGRASDKKTESQQQTTQSNPNEQIQSGIIETVKPGKDGAIWLSLKNNILVFVIEKHVDGDMVSGNFIKFRGTLTHKERLDFWALVALIELTKVQEGETVQQQDKTLTDDARKAAEDLEKIERGEQPSTVQGLVDSGAVKKGSDLPAGSGKKPGTIGLKRAQRIYVLCTQNKANNNGFNEGEIKKILQSLPVPLEHLRDLETSMHDQFELWAMGKEDWHQYWEKE